MASTGPELPSLPLKGSREPGVGPRGPSSGTSTSRCTGRGWLGVLIMWVIQALGSVKAKSHQAFPFPADRREQLAIAVLCRHNWPEG